MSCSGDGSLAPFTPDAYAATSAPICRRSRDGSTSPMNRAAAAAPPPPPPRPVDDDPSKRSTYPRLHPSHNLSPSESMT